MESLKEKLEKYRKNSKKKKDYYLVGEIKHNDKKIFELLRDEDENYYVKKIFEKPNEHFTRELLCMIDACDRGFPFVPLIEFDDQNEYGKSYIITPFMEGSNVVRQIIDKNKDDSFSEKDSSDIYLSTDLPHLAQIPIKPIDLNDTRKMIIIYGTAKAISFLHLQDRQIIHRDIKPENVLLDENGEPRLSDFGFARLINQKEFMSSIKGTLPYIAPELVREEKVDVKADIYSFGVFMIFLINEKLTFKEKGIDFNFYTLNKKKQMELAIKGVKYNIPNGFHPMIQKLMVDCCELDPSNRPTIKDVLKVLEDDSVTSAFDQQYNDYINKLQKK